MLANENFESESIEITESLCSQETLRFGCCEASKLSIRVLDSVAPMAGEQIRVYVDVQEAPDLFDYGVYKVNSDKPTADRRYRDIVAYDAMYDIINADVAEWYNTILPAPDSTVTLKQFRDSFISYFGLEQDEPEDGLINDDMTVTKTVEPSEMSGKTVITAICEINGCFGHIGRDGRFCYIHLKELVEGLYPSDTLYPRDDLYPADPMNSEKISGSYYISAEYEDFKTERINKLQIRQEENDVGCIYGDGDNCYIVQDNFLVYGKSAEELRDIAANLYSVICKISYRPASVEAKGNPCLEVGDGIRLCTRYEIIYTYILQRTLKGIQALRDTYTAEGEQYQAEKVNSVQNSIIQLKGKTNTLTRNVEETVSELRDTASRLNSTITQTASQIRAEVADTANNLQSQITANAGEIDLRVTYGDVVSAINLSPETITIEAGKIDLKGLVNADELVSKFATIATLNATTANLQNLIAQKATITDLNATNLKVQNLEIDKVSVTEFNATTANLQNLIAQKIDAATVKADYMEVANWTSAGYIKADRIDANTIVAKLGQFSGQVSVQDLLVQDAVVCRRVAMGALSITASAKWKNVTVDGTTYTVLCQG